MAVLHCRSCDAPLSSVFVDLGLTPISNAFVPIEQASSLERFYPLKCMVCDVCRLVQLADFETPDVHFHGDYIYFSSYSSSWLDHARRFVDMATERFRLGPDSNVVEVRSRAMMAICCSISSRKAFPVSASILPPIARRLPRPSMASKPTSHSLAATPPSACSIAARRWIS